jgi:pimeloyl-ACP methyl ester carboxylesterase
LSSVAAYEPTVERRERTLRINGVDYRVHEWGDADAPPLIYLHGWGDCAPSFQLVVDQLRGSHRVVAPDWRGFGDSGHNAAGYWFPEYLADLDGLLRALGIDEPVPVVGHSMGANVAALFAGVFPERVSAFINIEGFGLPDSNPADAPDHYRRWVEAGRQRRVHPGYSSVHLLLLRIRERSPNIRDDHAEFVASCWTRAGADGRLQLKADMAHRWPNAVLYRRAEAEACWRRISAPTLLICGADTRFREAMQNWHDEHDCPFPGARCVTIPGAGHMLHFEQPARLALLIDNFLAGQRGEPPYL